MKFHRFLCAVWTAALLVSLPSAAWAAPADPTAYTDAAQIAYWESVAALSQLGVMTGGEEFHPKDPVSRALCAKYMVLLRRGGEELVLSAEIEPHSDFSDVRGHWAQAYISYCEGAGILDGRGDGLFDPDAPVTGIEFAKMALATLGYDPVAYQLTGPDWDTMTNRVVLQLCSLSLYDGLQDVALSEPITREVAAQILYNMLGNAVIQAAPSPYGIEGELTYTYTVRKDADGQNVSFLSAYFGKTELEEVPPQPGK